MGMNLQRLSRFLAGSPPTRIDHQITYELGHEVVTRMKVHTTWVPDYRFVDLYRATEAYGRERGGAVAIESEHGAEDLNEILHDEPGRWTSRQIRGANKVAWPVAPGQEEYFPIDVFWLCRGRSASDGSSLVVRLRYVADSASALLEAASDRPDLAEQCVSSILESSARHSIRPSRWSTKMTW